MKKKKSILMKFFSSKEQVILRISLFVGSIILIFTLIRAHNYFSKNELLFDISEKYDTKELRNLQVESDTVFIRYSPIIQKNKATVVNLNLNNPLFPETENFFNRKVRLSKNDTIFKKKLQTTKDLEARDYYIINKDKESFQLGDIGDFLSGYFGLLLGLVGIIFTFIAFYVQYIANKEVSKQFRLQQFETQFQKLIDIYLNNKDKFEILGYKNIDNADADLAFNREINLLDKLKSIHSTKKGLSYVSTSSNLSQSISISNTDRKFIDYHTKDQIVFQKMLVELKCVYRVFLEAFKEKNGCGEQDLTEIMKKELFSLAYRTFFKGLNKFSKEYSEDTTISSIHVDIIKYSFSILIELRSIYKLDGTKAYLNFYKDGGDQWKTLWLKVNYEPFKGYLHFLPQYYRNLYTMVKFVVNENSDLHLNEDDKLKYLRILRSTMSDYEQAMLFYNWYSGIGADWENESNKFFSKYKMIHNMKKITLIDPQIDIFTIFEILPTDDFFENY